MGVPQSHVKVLPGDPPVEIVLRRSARARRLTLRVSALDGRISLTRPVGVTEAEAMRFACDKAPWIRAQVARMEPVRRVVPGAVIPVDGVPRNVCAGVPGVDAVCIRISAARPAGPQVAAILKTLARERLAAAVAHHAAVLGVSPGRLTLRDTRSRWGSCTGRGDLMFSWRLVMAPADVLDYVAAHEVAHLRHMDHSRAFWATVEQTRPDWRDHRKWLRTEGHALHAWRFAAD